MDKKIQMAQENMHTLSMMNQILFTTWQDEKAEHFSKGCLDKIEQEWKRYLEAITPLMRQLSKIKKEMEEYRERSQQR